MTKNRVWRITEVRRLEGGEYDTEIYFHRDSTRYYHNPTNLHTLNVVLGKVTKDIEMVSMGRSVITSYFIRRTACIT